MRINILFSFLCILGLSRSVIAKPPTDQNPHLVHVDTPEELTKKLQSFGDHIFFFALPDHGYLAWIDKVPVDMDIYLPDGLLGGLFYSSEGMHFFQLRDLNHYYISEYRPRESQLLPGLPRDSSLHFNDPVFSSKVFQGTNEVVFNLPEPDKFSSSRDQKTPFSLQCGPLQTKFTAVEGIKARQELLQKAVFHLLPGTRMPAFLFQLAETQEYLYFDRLLHYTTEFFGFRIFVGKPKAMKQFFVKEGNHSNCNNERTVQMTDGSVLYIAPDAPDLYYKSHNCGNEAAKSSTWTRQGIKGLKQVFNLIPVDPKTVHIKEWGIPEFSDLPTDLASIYLPERSPCERFYQLPLSALRASPLLMDP